MVTKQYFKRGTGGVVVVIADSPEEAREAGAAAKAAIDFMRSPFLEGPYEDDDGKFRCRIAYYGLD